MGQSGAPHEPESGGAHPTMTPPHVSRPEEAVVMGRCLPLAFPDHSVTSPPTPPPPHPLTNQTRSDVRVEENSAKRNVVQGEDHQSSRSQPHRRTERDTQTFSSRQPMHEAATRSEVATHQSGGVPNTRLQGATSSFPCHTSSSSVSRVNEVVAKRDCRIPNHQAGITEQPGHIRKQQPILRRTLSTGTPQSKVMHNNNNDKNNNKNSSDSNNSKAPTESLLARIKARVEQLAPAAAAASAASGKDEISGKEAWEITQRKKALMREEFFKIPYEECNKEAARSLGGRLNKSEPRLNTICKDRKKRNSFSYKRRVHFDLDEDRDLDDAFEPSRTGKYEHSSGLSRRNSAHSFVNVGPPKKVVVSIYSIDDPAKRVQQVHLPDGYCEGGQVPDVPTPQTPPARTPTTTTPSPTPLKEYRNRSGVIIGRPTDLDSLQREVTVRTTTITTTTPKDATADHRSSSSSSDSDSSEQEVRRKSSLKSSTSVAESTSRFNTTTCTGRDSQKASPDFDLSSRRYSLPPPLQRQQQQQQMSVRPRHPSAHSFSTSDNKSDTARSQTMVSDSHRHHHQQQHTTHEAHAPPVPAPRFCITSALKKSHSVQDDFGRNTTSDVATSPQPTHPAPKDAHQQDDDTCKDITTVSPTNPSPSLKKSQSVQDDFCGNISADVTTSSQHTALQTPQQTRTDAVVSTQATRRKASQNAVTSCDNSSSRSTPQTRLQPERDSESSSVLHKPSSSLSARSSPTPSDHQIASRPETLNLCPDTPVPTSTSQHSRTATVPRVVHPQCPSSGLVASSSVSSQVISRSGGTSNSGVPCSSSSSPPTRPAHTAAVKDVHHLSTPGGLCPIATPTVHHPLTPPHTPSPPRTPPTPPRSVTGPHPSKTHAPTELHTPVTPPRTAMTPAPHAIIATPPTTPHTPATTPTATPTPTVRREELSPLIPPIPKPRKRISVSQQTSTPPSQSPAHTPQSPAHTPQSPAHTPQSPAHNPHRHQTPQSSSSRTTQSPKRHTANKPAILTPKPTLTSQPPAAPSTTVAPNKKVISKSSQPSGHIITPHTRRVIPKDAAKQMNGNGGLVNNKVSHKMRNKENQSVRSSQKTDDIDKGNSVNILMTKGESYSKHNIVLSSHVSSPVPSVTVRKIFVPVVSSSAAAPSRCSPSPTPSCASSSCSFGSSGSSSGCFSGSPSPTPTPSPTRIRSSGVPTDL